MFKPGDKVIVVDEEKSTTVVATRKNSSCVVTSIGAFDETELSQGHPSVIATANNKDADEEGENSFLLSKLSEIEEVKDAENWFNTELRIELMLALGTALDKGALNTDILGHWKHGKALKSSSLSDLFKPVDLPPNISTKDATDLLDVLEFNAENKDNKHSLDKFIILSVPFLGSFDCTYCEARNLLLETNGETIRFSGASCSHPDGLEPNEWDLNVPSGKIVVGNDLRRWFPFPDGDGEFDLNSFVGMRAVATRYADIGMSHAYVGNTCPSVFRTSSGAYKIANKRAEERWDEEKKEYVPCSAMPEFDGEELANICTDLWWYSICDFDEFARRTEKFGGSLDDIYNAVVVTVKPGVYRFKHDDDAGSGKYNSCKETIHATFDWVREPDPIKDYLSEYEQAKVNAHAYVQGRVQAWPTLYGSGSDTWSGMTEEQRLNSWQNVANHIFCTIGSGTGWHEKGFPASAIDPSIPDIEPPSFRRQYSWYPFSKDYSGLFTVPLLEPSFAKLAFRVLESIISFGMKPHSNWHSREVQQVRNRMLQAVNRYRELSHDYPELADPDYVSWLSEDGRAEAWVARFDLGDVYTQKHLDHQAQQRWVPEGAYAIEFNANNLGDTGGDHFVGSTGYWSDQKNATGYAIQVWSNNGESDERQNCFWASNAGRTAVPLCFTARVVKLGEVSHMGYTLVELGFDYGADWMQDATVRKAVAEQRCKDAIRILTKEEYEVILADKRNMGK